MATNLGKLSKLSNLLMHTFIYILKISLFDNHVVVGTVNIHYQSVTIQKFTTVMTGTVATTIPKPTM